MSSPRDPGRDLSLELLGGRDGLRRAHLGEAAQVRTLQGPASSVQKFSTAYQALVDAAFTGPGSAQWLSGLRRRVAAILAGREGTRPHALTSNSIRVGSPDLGRF
jgi:hypothetical protein